MADYLKMVEQREAELNALFARMDKEKDLYYLKAFTLKDNDGREIPNVNNLTLNDPAVFAKRAIAILAGAEMQTVVEGEGLTDKQTTFIEGFLDGLDFAVNAQLAELRGWASAFAFYCEQIALRGRVSARCLLRMDGKKFVPDILPLDGRYLIHEVGADGLNWVAYKTSRTKAKILAEYDIQINSATAVVTDFWDEEFNRIFISSQQAREQKNTFGYLPFVIQISGGGSMLQDEDALEHEGEGVLSLNCDLYPELNRLATILHTLNELSFNAGMQYESGAGEQAKKPTLPPYGKRFVLPVEKGGGFKPMPINDIRDSTRLLYSMLEGRIQRGSLPAVDYGNLTFPLSAVAISRLTEGRDQIFLPRIQALAMFKQQLGKMAIRQYVDGKMKVELGQGGYTQQYPYQQLKGDYTVKYRFFTTSAEQKIADLAVARSAQGFLSDDTIRRDILKLPNPNAERVNPAIALYRHACSLIEEEEYIEARLVAEQLMAMLKQRKMAGPTAPTEGRPGQEGIPGVGRELIPLLTAGGGGARRQPKAEEERE